MLRCIFELHVKDMELLTIFPKFNLYVLSIQKKNPEGKLHISILHHN